MICKRQGLARWQSHWNQLLSLTPLLGDDVLHEPLKSRAYRNAMIYMYIYTAGNFTNYHFAEDKKMGVISRRVLPLCSICCVCCPALRARSRHPVKRYKTLLAEIFPRSQVTTSTYFTYFYSIWDVRLSIIYLPISRTINILDSWFFYLVMVLFETLIIFLINNIKLQDGEPNERKIGKLCEYASKNPLRIPKVILVSFNLWCMLAEI